MSERFRVAAKKNDDVDIVFFIGRLDVTSAVQAEEFIQNLIETGARKIGIHCGELSYMSSAGLRVILGSFMQIRELDGDVRLSNLKPEIKEIISMCGFDEVFSIYPDDIALIESYSS
ncbi:STAS domain-containing protein [uncultured Methanospirillum sp.]|uniref:STAS domain-containing protein n=1 Tax=uncultured Methanospirillum sp. TaxID=262503 RepID=UPI0029C82000|nr:STAS domain-containing protein [uncultured Methanospirillum sp.]